MSEGVVVAIVAVASTLLLACAGAIWRLAVAVSEGKAALAALVASVAKTEATLTGAILEAKVDTRERIARVEKLAEDQNRARGVEVEKLSARIEDVEEAAEIQRREDEKQWRSWTGVISGLVGEIKAQHRRPLLPDAPSRPPRPASRRSKPDEEP